MINAFGYVGKVSDFSTKKIESIGRNQFHVGELHSSRDHHSNSSNFKKIILSTLKSLYNFVFFDRKNAVFLLRINAYKTLKIGISDIGFMSGHKSIQLHPAGAPMSG